eukprot:3035261-Rhodomonas_salina.1
MVGRMRGAGTALGEQVEYHARTATMARICKLSLLVILLFVEGVTARKVCPALLGLQKVSDSFPVALQILKSKIRARGSTYSIAKDSDLHMCKAVVSERRG